MPGALVLELSCGLTTWQVGDQLSHQGSSNEPALAGLGQSHAGRHHHRQSVQGLSGQVAGLVVILETDRLTLRHLEVGDLDALHRLYSDPQVRAHFPEGTLTLEETREELEWFLQGHPDRPELGLWAAVERCSGAFLGRCGLLPWTIDGKSEVELAYLIDKSRWGEGLATEAARGIIRHASEQLGLNRLICLIMPGKLASAAVATKVGMTFERECTGDFGLCHIYSLRV
jgi:ribosomal-protein-alanine N-acetyltransferase